MDAPKRPFLESQDIGLSFVICFFYALAFATTGVRLWRRYTVGRLWWDDVLALLSVCGGVWLFILYWMKEVPKDSVMTQEHFSRVRFWMGALMAWITLWFTRISLALGTARIFPPRHIAYRIGLWAAGIFFLCLVSLLIMVTTECTKNNFAAWKQIPNMRSRCFIPEYTIYYSMTLGFSADAYLILVPLIALWNLKAPSTFRLMLRTTFTGNIIVALVTSLIVIFQHLDDSLEPWRSQVTVRLNYVEGAVAIIVCNLIVCVPLAYRVLYGQSITGDQGPTSDDTEMTRRKRERKTPGPSGVVTPNIVARDANGDTVEPRDGKERDGHDHDVSGALGTKKSGVSLRTDRTSDPGESSTNLSSQVLSNGGWGHSTISGGGRTTGIWSSYDPESMGFDEELDSQQSRRSGRW